MIYCCECKTKVEPILKTGLEIYPNREDLKSLFFYSCPFCKNFVGTHKNSKNIKPLGAIPNKDIKIARQYIHALIDPIWKSGKITRKKLYSLIAERLGKRQYHTAWIQSVEEARNVYRVCKSILNELKEQEQ